MGAAALCCLLMLCAVLCSAAGEDVFILDVDALNMDRLNNNDYVAENLTARVTGLRVQKYISDSGELAEPVRLTLVRMDTQTLLMDKDYGYQSNVFDSGVLYLTYAGGVIPYLVTLYVGNTVYAMPFMQLQPRLEYNSACTYGLRMRDLGLGSDWLMGTMLDLNALRAAGTVTLDICASNAYVIGRAIVQMQNEALCVQLDMDAGANVEINGLSLYVTTNCAALGGGMGGVPAFSVGQWIDVSGANSAFLYMPMQVSYDPAGLYAFDDGANGGYLQNQLMLWEQNRSGASQSMDAPIDPYIPVGEGFVTAEPYVPTATETPVFPAEPIVTETPTELPVQPTELPLPEQAAQPTAEPLPEQVAQPIATEPPAFVEQAEPIVTESISPEPTDPPQPNGNAGVEG